MPRGIIRTLVVVNALYYISPPFLDDADAFAGRFIWVFIHMVILDQYYQYRCTKP